MNFALTILGCATADTTNFELATSRLVVGDAAVACTQAVPPAAGGQELQLRVLADDTVTVQGPVLELGHLPETDADP